MDATKVSENVTPRKIWTAFTPDGFFWGSTDDEGLSRAWASRDARLGEVLPYYHIPDERTVQLKNTKSVLMRELKDYPDADHTTHMALSIALKAVGGLLTTIEGEA